MKATRMIGRNINASKCETLQFSEDSSQTIPHLATESTLSQKGKLYLIGVLAMDLQDQMCRYAVST